MISIENINLAEQTARKGKRHQYGVQDFDRDREANIIALHEMLKNKTYKTSKYKVFDIADPKPREISCLPYFPDRIVHHLIMIPLEKIFVDCFTSDTYSCIKGRGIHAASRKLKTALKDIDGTTYCLKLDITKFYRNVDHEILKQLILRKIKDKDLLWLLDEIIDSAAGLPIGNYLSQYLANFYLTYFDHWIKEEKREKYYFRYADDIVILSSDKTHLHELLHSIRIYLDEHLKLSVKRNYQVFPVASRSIDFVGYRFYHTHILLRKSIKQNFARMLKRRKNKPSMASYIGWAKHCDSINLLDKLVYGRLEKL